MLQLSLRKTLLRGCTSTFLVRNFSGTSKQSVFNITVKSARQEYQRDLSHKILYAFLGVALVEIYWRGSEGPSVCDLDVDCGVNFESGQAFTNWSSTHSCHPKRVYEPKSAQEVVRVLKLHHDRKTKLRPVGQALSPNGVGLSDPEARDKPSSDENMLSLAAIDYVEVDKEQQLVTVGAGATVSTVLKELRRHGLTLQNFSSIQEQQLGGWTQVAAHGTGCTLPTVDEMIVNMKVATPTEGIISLSETANPHYFRMAKVGLGSLGVVTELTLKCIPSMDLLEKTESSTRSLLNDEDHIERLKAFRHVRYMWIPYTPTVVTVVSNPVSTLTQADACSNCRSASSPSDVTVANATGQDLPTKPLSGLLLELQPKLDKKETEKLSFSQLRDLLLDINPLDLNLVKRINAAEAQFWQASSGSRRDDSINILGFDCGGEQWVLEVCFNIGPLPDAVDDKAGVSQSKDLEFVRRLLEVVEKNGVPAPSPIEQRWTARSTSPMSPAYSPNEKDVFSWVGIIMYLPPGQSDTQRASITRRFQQYCELIQPLLDEYDAHVHWAKIELPPHPSPGKQVLTKEDKEDLAKYKDRLEYQRARLAKKYPLKLFNAFRDAIDPHSILSNRLVDEMLSDKKDRG